MNDSFFRMGALAQAQASLVVRLHQLLNWSWIESKLIVLYKREQTRGVGKKLRSKGQNSRLEGQLLD